MRVFRGIITALLAAIALVGLSAGGDIVTVLALLGLAGWIYPTREKVHA